MSKILVVDDEMDVLTMLSTLLRNQGYDVVVTDDGNEAIDLLRGKERFDLMISDVRMIPINGIWLLSFVKEECPAMPVIMVTAYYSKDVAVEALKMGAFDYISKPFNTEELLSQVKLALQAKKKPAAPSPLRYSRPE